MSAVCQGAVGRKTERWFCGRASNGCGCPSHPVNHRYGRVIASSPDKMSKEQSQWMGRADVELPSLQASFLSHQGSEEHANIHSASLSDC